MILLSMVSQTFKTGAKMNKKQLVAKLAGSLNQSKADAERTFDTITTVSYTHLTLPTILLV